MNIKDKKRKIIINTAVKLFVERGFHGTPTSLIAKEAEIATGTLFNYFKTKDILINEIFKDVKTKQINFILRDFNKENNSKEKLRKIWDNLILWGIENPQEKKFVNYFSNSNYISDDTKTEINKNYKFMLEIFKNLISIKNIKNTNELMLIFNFLGACIFTGNYFSITNEPYDEKLSRESFERYCKSIRLTEED